MTLLYSGTVGSACATLEAHDGMDNVTVMAALQDNDNATCISMSNVPASIIHWKMKYAEISLNHLETTSITLMGNDPLECDTIVNFVGVGSSSPTSTEKHSQYTRCNQVVVTRDTVMNRVSCQYVCTCKQFLCGEALLLIVDKRDPSERYDLCDVQFQTDSA